MIKCLKLKTYVNNKSLFIAILALALSAVTVSANESAKVENNTPIKVEIKKNGNAYQLYRDGKPYEIKGAGLEFGDMKSFAEHGGNSIRNWTTDNGVESTLDILDRALANNVTVALCLSMGKERWGFDYNDKEAVAKQLQKVREEVLKYRNHPALLAWIIGNELNLSYTNSKVYDAVNDVSKMIHEIDPYHPTTTTTAGLDNKVLHDLTTRASDLDFVSFQVYGELAILPDFIEENAYKKPFAVTEWGAIGYWEMEKTSWGAPYEMHSTAKAKVFLEGYLNKLKPLSNQLIGSYVFLWGQKQERTPTWFGLFTEAGDKTEAVDVMHYIWNGKWPDNRAPQLRSIHLDGKIVSDNITLQPGQDYIADVDAYDYENDKLSYSWLVKPESQTDLVGGDFEKSINNLKSSVKSPTVKQTIITAAKEPGAYRLFVYAYDGKGHTAHANIPFFVKEK
ncbi:MAG: hypothetical protein ACI9IA_001239 [Enterobacterales bacterium]|jgi:hypothetical protein